MSKYFTEIYKKYYENLTSTSFNTKTIQEKISEIRENNKKLVSDIETSNWKELGKTEVLTNIIPSFTGRIEIFINNLTNNLLVAASKSTDVLLPLLEDLKNKSDNYDALEQLIAYNNQNELDNTKNNQELNALDSEMKELVTKIDNTINEIKSLSNMKELNGSSEVAAITNKTIEEPKQTVSNSNSSNNVSDYNASANNQVTDYNNQTQNDELAAIDARISELKEKIRNRKKDIYAVDIAKEFWKIKLSLEEEKRNSYESDAVPISSAIDAIDKNKVKVWSTLNGEWIIPNTKISIADYATYAHDKGIRQDSNSSRYGDLCLAFSYVHASNMYTGYTGDNAESAVNWAHASEFKDYFSDSKEATLNTIYKEITNGKPVVLQVNGNSSGTHRHFVTVVGIKSSVTSANELKESDLLIYDSWDGKVERMDTSSSRFMTTGKQTNKSYSGYYLRLLK